MKRMLFIYNPRAGRGEIRTALSHVIEEFTGSGYEVVVHPTMGAQDAARTVAARGEAFDLIVCSGGDGTMNEAVTGMLSAGFSRPLGYIPAGSTNDYASSLGIPTQMRSAAAAIVNGSVFRCDVGKLNDNYFVYVAAFGAFVETSYETSQDMKNFLGHAAYILKGMQSLPYIKSYRMSYSGDDVSGEGRFLYGMITNSNSVGGFRGITGRDVNLSDGVFEVTLVQEPPNPLEYAGIINALMGGEKSRYLISFKTAHLALSFEEEVNWTRDGEFGGKLRNVEILNLKKVLPIILPDESAGGEIADKEDSGEDSGEEDTDKAAAD